MNSSSRSQPVSGGVVGSEPSAAFTPGPWFFGEDDSNGQAVVRGEHTEVATCWHHCVVEIEREMQANARLIAAAPDLLEALRLLVSWTDALDSKGASHRPNDAFMAPIRAAIAKATAQ